MRQLINYLVVFTIYDMPPKQTATTAEQAKFVISWLEKDENRLSCFGGSGAKAKYGCKDVVKPGTAYNSLAQAVNSKFGCSWTGESAKSRIRTMKVKFEAVFVACKGKVDEESETWRLTDSDKEAGVFTLADKAQRDCPYWNNWLKWCGSDPNLARHGSGTIDAFNVEGSSNCSSCSEEDNREDDLAADVANLDGSAASDAHEEEVISFAAFGENRLATGDRGNCDSDDEAGRPIATKAGRAPYGSAPSEAENKAAAVCFVVDVLFIVYALFLYRRSGGQHSQSKEGIGRNKNRKAGVTQLRHLRQLQVLAQVAAVIHFLDHHRHRVL